MCDCYLLDLLFSLSELFLEPEDVDELLLVLLPEDLASDLLLLLEGWLLAVSVLEEDLLC